METKTIFDGLPTIGKNVIVKLIDDYECCAMIIMADGFSGKQKGHIQWIDLSEDSIGMFEIGIVKEWWEYD